MDNRENLTSYDNVESVQLHELTEEGLRAYMKAKLESAKSNQRFIERFVYAGTPIKVCEIGSGNSKLLYALEMDNVLGRGAAYEVSQSRYEMAEKFKELLGSQNVRNINANFLDIPPSNDSYDLVVMVDIVFQIVAPLYDKAVEETLTWIRDSLHPSGKVFMEIEDFSAAFAEIEANDGVLQKWVEFDEADPFQYALHRITRDEDGNLVVQKTHIRRNSNERDRFQNVIRSYTEKDMVQLLEHHGFDVQIFPGEFEAGEYRGTKRFRVLATKRD